MFTRVLLATVLGLAVADISQAQVTRTRKPGSSDTWAVYKNVNTGPMRTTLTRENKFLEPAQVEFGGFYEHDDNSDLDTDSDTLGVYGRLGLLEFMTAEADVPFVDSDLSGDSESGIGDVVLKLDLLAFQDIFRYPFIIPHIDVSLPTGDEDKGLGTGETGVTLGISVGTKVYEQLTYVLDIAYAMNGGNGTYDDDDIGMLSGSIVWDVSDRFALLTEGRVYEKNSYDNYPYRVLGGLAYRFTPDVQVAGYGGVERNETDLDSGKVNIAAVKVSVQF